MCLTYSGSKPTKVIWIVIFLLALSDVPPCRRGPVCKGCTQTVGCGLKVLDQWWTFSSKGLEEGPSQLKAIPLVGGGFFSPPKLHPKRLVFMPVLQDTRSETVSSSTAIGLNSSLSLRCFRQTGFEPPPRSSRFFTSVWPS